MFKKPKRSGKTGSIRKKRNDDDSDGDDDGGGGGGPHTAKKRRTRTYRASNDASSSDDDGGEGGGGSSTSALLAQLKADSTGRKNRRQQRKGGAGGGVATSSSGTGGAKKRSVMHEYEPDGGSGLTAQDMATRTAEYHPTTQRANNTEGNDGDGDDEKGGGIYRGRKEKRSKFLAGPLKAPTFVRTTCRFDYQPDICKDYKETGFCGFGDTCIYLHDRGDTLTGWQLERQWEEKRKAERDAKEREMDRFLAAATGGGQGEGDDGDGAADGDASKGAGGAADDGIPFACYMCRGPFADPIVTSCGHYFCQRCIMERFQSDPCCPVCNKDTHGVFNHPAKLHSKKRRVVGRDASWDEFAKAFQSGDAT